MQVKTFAKMRSSQRAKVADALQKVSFGAGEQIIRQGADGDLFYIIEKGDVIITENDSDLNMVRPTRTFSRANHSLIQL